MARDTTKTAGFSWTALGVSIGPGVGLTIGLVGWGAEGIPLGLAFGAGIGVALGAALDGRRDDSDT